MMRRVLALLFFHAISSAVVAAVPEKAAPPPLLAQVHHLSELLRDSYAVLYPGATMVQFVKPSESEELALVVFTLEGYGGGNSHIQYFAAFTLETDEKGKQHFPLIDVIPVAGKGWRGIEALNAKVTRNSKSHEILIAVDALEVTADDAPNFPSKKITINLLLKNGRLVEQELP